MLSFIKAKPSYLTAFGKAVVALIIVAIIAAVAAIWWLA